jgi:NAD-dependent deacetylase
MPRVVVLTGAGISAESGLQTFRGADGLWEGHRVEDVACPEAWARDSGLVLDFYNQRRRAVRAAEPNAAHRALVDLERAYDVRIVTQNVDDLHERAGSTQVLHLHGEIMRARSTRNPSLVRHLGERDIELGDLCELGSQLRPHIVWFGEMVPAMDEAVELVAEADVLLVVGTSLQVYPAAGLVFEAPKRAQRIVVNPDVPDRVGGPGFEVVAKPATVGVPEVVAGLLAAAGAGGAAAGGRSSTSGSGG